MNDKDKPKHATFTVFGEKEENCECMENKEREWHVSTVVKYM